MTTSFFDYLKQHYTLKQALIYASFLKHMQTLDTVRFKRVDGSLCTKKMEKRCVISLHVVKSTKQLLVSVNVEGEFFYSFYTHLSYDFLAYNLQKKQDKVLTQYTALVETKLAMDSSFQINENTQNE